MNYIRTPVTSSPTLMMSDVIDKVGSDPSLSPTRRRDLISSLRRTCQLLNRDPRNLPADVSLLRRGMVDIHPVQVGISEKTLQNHKANVLAAVRLTSDGRSSKRPLSPEWQRLANLLPTKRLKGGVSRLLHYCSDNGIPADQLSDAVIAEFIDDVRTSTFVKKPNDIHRRTSRIWNEAVEVVPGWPKNRLTIPTFRKPRRSTPLQEFPASFQKDVNDHTNWLSGINLFADHAPPQVCKPRTIELRRRQIELAASALLRQGWSIDDFNSLADLVTVDAAKAILSDYLESTNTQPGTFVRSLATTLIYIARHWVRADQQQVGALKELKRRLGSERPGMTDKNTNMLRQFADERNILRLLELPDDLVAEAQKKKLSAARAAIRVQLALAISILTNAPLRMHNLIGLRLDTNIIRPGGDLGPVHLVIPEDEAKGGFTIDYPLADTTRGILDLYLAQYRPVLCNEDCQWLFPTKGNKQKSQTTLSQQVKEVVKKRTGLEMTPHQFRHLAAKLYLDQNPGQFEVVRQLLAHKSIKSTTTFYTKLQTATATQHYDQMLGEKREALARQYRNKGGKK